MTHFLTTAIALVILSLIPSPAASIPGPQPETWSCFGNRFDKTPAIILNAQDENSPDRGTVFIGGTAHYANYKLKALDRLWLWTPKHADETYAFLIQPNRTGRYGTLTEHGINYTGLRLHCITGNALSASEAATPMNIPEIPDVAALRRGLAAGAEALEKTLNSKLSEKAVQKKAVGLRYTVPAIYPRIAKKEGWEGTVTLRVVVDVKGKPAEITVDKSSGHKVLDDAAIRAVRKWIFSPAKDGNIPIRSSVKIPIHFSLTQQG